MIHAFAWRDCADAVVLGRWMCIFSILWAIEASEGTNQCDTFIEDADEMRIST